MGTFHVAIVGGGVTGLVVARELRRHGIAVTLISATFPFGGRLGCRTFDVPDFGRATFETGALYFPDRHPRPTAVTPHGFPPLGLLRGEFGTVRPPWMHAVPLVVVDRAGTLHGGETPPRPRAGGAQRLVNHFLPTAPDEHYRQRTQTEVAKVEPHRDGWRVRTRHRAADGAGWDAGEPVSADALVLTQPLPDVIDLLDASGFKLPDGLRDELRAVTYDPGFVLHAVHAQPTGMPAPIVRFDDGGPLHTIADNQALGASAVGPAVTVEATFEWSRLNWALPDEEVAKQLLALSGPWAGRPEWHQLVRCPRAHCRGPLRLPFAQLNSPPLFFAGDGFSACAGAGLDRAYTSARYAADRVRQVLRAAPARGGRAAGAGLTLEVVVTSASDAVRAVANGAHRLLLCSALEVGGLTPTVALLRSVRTALEPFLRDRPVPVTVMLRPRPGGFVYGLEECDLMAAEAADLLAAGADGVVFGVLELRDGETSRVNIKRTRELVELARSYRKEASFNRAFDLIADRRAALHELIQLGAARVYTSGRRRLALDGIGELEADVQFAGWELAVVPTGGITAGTVGAVVRGTGCTQVLASFRRPVADPSAAGSPLADQMSASGAGGQHAALDPAGVDGAARTLRDLERQPDPPPEE